MKVLYLIETLGVGGAEQSLLQILPRLSAVQPVMCHLYEGDELKPAFEAAGIPVVSLDVPPKYHFRMAIKRVEGLVRRERPDLIHSTLFRAEVVGRVVGRRRRIPVISSFVSECYADIRWRMLSPSGRIKLKGIQLLDRLTAPLASHFVANSATVKGSESRSLRVPPESVTVIHRGRDSIQFMTPLTDEQRHAYLESLEISAEAPIVINVGRLVNSKGHSELIDAFVRVSSVLPDAVLLLAGEGPERANIEQQIRRLSLEGQVRLLGRRDDVPQLLAFADVFAFPSHYEGHPGSVVEAMFAGKPIVVSDTPVHRETISDGECGLLVSLRSPAPLAEAILTLLRDQELAGRLGNRAREIARRHFDIDQTADRYAALYRRVLEEYSPKGH